MPCYRQLQRLSSFMGHSSHIALAALCLAGLHSGIYCNQGYTLPVYLQINKPLQKIVSSGLSHANLSKQDPGTSHLLESTEHIPLSLECNTGLSRVFFPLISGWDSVAAHPRMPCIFWVVSQNAKLQGTLGCDNSESWLSHSHEACGQFSQSSLCSHPCANISALWVLTSMKPEGVALDCV